MKIFGRLSGLCFALVVTLAAASAFADSGSAIVAGGGEVSFENATTNWITYTEGGATKTDFVMVFSNANEAASFTLPGMTSARILAVGGGGGGGGIYTHASGGGKAPYAGGGGGGAGGFVELPTALYNEGTYVINVGTGGVAGVGNGATAKNKGDFTGGDGGDTTIVTNGVTMVTAYGGGGGGGQRAGREGASGGGGAYEPTSTSAGTPSAGGLAKEDGAQGHDGGVGNEPLFGGGGGGAGGAGQPGGATGTHGVGGDGLPSDITGDERWYAGGGGGGCCDKNVTGQTSGIAGGKGGGGQGGNGRSPADATATTPGGDAYPGVDGTGGGGGGAGKNSTTAAGMGGCGVVIVRIAASLDGALDKPADKQVRHDGAFHEIVTSSPFIEIVDGVNGGTDVGTYTVTVKPVGAKWTDGTDDEVKVTLVIYSESALPETTVKVTGADVTFVGADEYSWIDNGDDTKDLLIKFTGVGIYKLPGSSQARILAVGGGGGGGGIYTHATGGGKAPYAGGGGGGAGGFVELPTALYEEGSYVVNVGTGGVAGVGSGATAKNKGDFTGGDGGDTTITLNGTALVTAYGGGGGGGQRAGREGASGGGGAYEPTSTSAGQLSDAGKAMNDGAQGCDGGKGDVPLYGGGGGGAGGPGGDAGDTTTHGVGGIGRQSSITNANGAAVSEWGWFAGGGGGGCCDKNVTGQTVGIAGGKGGGGQGGNGRSPADATATTPGGDAYPGVDGTGGGGGGAGKNSTSAAGKGGCGVVYVRISSAMVGPFVKPTDPDPIPYDRNAHTSLVETVFYTVEGDNVGTNVGSYVATAKLKGDGEWPDHTKDPVTITMTILPRAVTVSNLSLANWEYLATPNEPTCTADPAWAADDFVYEYKAKDAPETDWSAAKPTLAGDYRVRVRIRDEVAANYVLTAEPADFAVTRIEVTFTDLLMRDWMEGTPEEETPEPLCTVTTTSGVKVEPTFEYATNRDAPAEEWTDVKPSAAGTYVVRVRAPDFDNYAFEMKYADFSILKGLANLFTDYVKVTIQPGAGEAEKVPFKLTLTEEKPTVVGTKPYGFLYERAGVDGEALAVTDMDGKPLPYKVLSWNEGGESEICFELPKLSATEPQSVYVYWHLRENKKVPEHAYDPAAIPPVQPAYAFDLVRRDGRLVNYWITEPKMDKYEWASDDPVPGRLIVPAVLAEGVTLTNVINAFSRELVGHVIPTTEVGKYRALFVPDDPRGIYWPPDDCYVDVNITGVIEVDTLGGATGDVTLNGRTLLVNDDEAAGHVVENQGYWQTNVVDGTTYKTYWDHGTQTHRAPSGVIPNVQFGLDHALVHIDGTGATNLLWRLQDVMIGNTMVGESGFGNVQCYLPWSSTARGISSKEAGSKPLTSRAEVSHLVLRNRMNAAVYSPYYPDGVGTIYFDAVNGWFAGDGSSYPTKDAYKIVVEVATLTDFNEIPTDENCRAKVGDSTFPYLDNIDTNWVSVAMLPLKRDNNATEFTEEPMTKTLALGIETRSTTNNFYRVCVPVNVNGPCRFRIRRVSTGSCPNFLDTNDRGGFILLDNIVVSYPKMTAWMEPFGTNVTVKTETGVRVMGWAGSMQTPFPAVGAKDVLARANPIRSTSGLTNVNAKTLITQARLHYRWLYPNQRSNEWDVVKLEPANDFVADKPLALPAHEADIQFWLENDTQIPYYRYYDYSGAGLGLAGSTYSEAVGTVTNSYVIASRRGLLGDGSEKDSAAPLANGEKEWFFRLRNGRSDVERFVLDVQEGAGGVIRSQSIDFEVTGNRIWRAFLPTPTNAIGAVKFRLRSLNEQDPASAEYAAGYAVNTNYWVLTTSSIPVGSSGIGSFAPGGENEWSELVLDGKTGQVMIQIDDKARSLTAVHGERQNFNLWTDANKKDGQGLFLGQVLLNETNDLAGASGTSDKTQKFMAAFDTWYPSVSVDPAYWLEAFAVDPKDIGPGTNYPLDEPFGSKKTPNGWRAGPGQWTTTFYGDKATGLALQMQGQGYGYLQFVDATHNPRGLKSISFTSRLAQFQGFNDFCYWDESTPAKSKMKDYTFVAKGAFDTNKSTEFAGAATLSAVAYYRWGVGCYEFRVTQKTATMKGATPSGAGLVRTLRLYRWSVDPSTRQLVSKQLGTDYDVTWTTDENTSWLTSGEGTTSTFPVLFISCSNAVDGASTVIRAGVSRKGQTPNIYTALESACLTYTDNDPAHLTAGTFGVGSANCPARFTDLSWYDKPVKGEKAPNAGTLTKTNKATPTWQGTRQKCAISIKGDQWALPPDRIAKAGTGEADELVGFRTQVMPQEIEVYTAPAGTESWGEKPINTFLVSNFGAAGVSATNTIPLYTTDDCSVRIRVAGTIFDARYDVVIDNVQLEQWRGESYDEDVKRKDAYPADQLAYGCPTNFVFSTAWVNEGDPRTVKLSARRTTETQAASIRSPLMDGQEGRGLGLGFLSFAWENAQTNAVLLVQVATNAMDKTSLATITKSTSANYWSTVTNVNVGALARAGQTSGNLTVYLGLHGQKGVMRVAIDPEVVKEVAKLSPSNAVSTTAFGEVDIVSMSCSDEPDIDARSWWGWNLRTTDETQRLWIGDNPTAEDPAGGMAFALNNSVSADVRHEYGAAYNEHLPFLQTPALAEQLIGEITFKARRYDKVGSEAYGERTFVTLYGSNASETPDKQWTPVTSWEVTNDVYETFTYRAAQGIRYAVLRLAVTGVEAVKEDGYMPKSKPTEVSYKPLRVLIDELTVSESVEARVAFRNVRAFRWHLDETTMVEDIMERDEQPLCKESFGVQGEVYAAQLGDEVDLSKAKVRLWWYPRQSPWGFENWKGMAEAKNAWLAESSDTKGVFRSSYLACPSAVIEQQMNRTTVQFMLEVVWKSTKDGTTNTNWLERADWVNPPWYAPVDLNQRPDGQFCGYTILDTVAPGWAWINEINLFGEYYNGWNNTDRTLQFLEVAAPGDADLTGWQIRFLNAQADENRVVTNVAAQFGRELPGKKKDLKGMDDVSKYVFHVAASPLTEGSLKLEDGRVDGYWKITELGKEAYLTGELKSYEPVSVQLVRPSGIVESEVTAIGTNIYWTSAARNPEKHVEYLNAHEQGGHWIYVGADDTGSDAGSQYEWSHALGVFAGNGSSPLQWNSVNTMTPGRMNKEQYITPDWPHPLGSSIVIYAMLEGDHVWQQLGDSPVTNATVTMVFRKGDEAGTNITYQTAPWYEIGAVTNNGVRVYPQPVAGGVRTWTLNVAKNVSNDVTVTACATVDSRLERDYGILPDDPYRLAIVDWLTKGVDMSGTRWNNPDATDLGLADFVNAADEVVTNLNLKGMYWLDIDPTWEDHVMRLKGYLEPPLPLVVSPGVTNVRTAVFMMITNTATDEAWAPYVLRGSDPAFTSWDYAAAGSHAREWGDVNFKVTGILVNGPEEEGDFSRRNWLPLRNFVFNGSTAGVGTRPTSSSFENFRSEIEVKDPYKKDSPGYSAGWYDWVQEHGWSPVWWRWDLDERTRPQSVEVLKKRNWYE